MSKFVCLCVFFSSKTPQNITHGNMTSFLKQITPHSHPIYTSVIHF